MVVVVVAAAAAASIDVIKGCRKLCFRNRMLATLEKQCIVFTIVGGSSCTHVAAVPANTGANTESRAGHLRNRP